MLKVLTYPEKRPQNGQEMADFLMKKLNTLFEKSEIEFAYLGGSWSEGANYWWSDIDIFVSLPHCKQKYSEAQLTYLTQLTMKMTEITYFDEIEISVFETIPLHVQFDVIYNGILLYEKTPGVKANFVEKLLPKYYDHMIWYERLLKHSNFLSTSEKSK